MRFSNIRELLEILEYVVEFYDRPIVDINMTGISGNTPLAVVTSWSNDQGCLQAAHLLLDAGADVNAQIEDDDTVLHRAVSMGNIELVRLYIEHGAKTDIKNIYGYTAIDVARLLQRDDITELLLASVGDRSKLGGKGPSGR